ncbi:MAG: ribonuclease H-like YkuK family protein, partial [Carboxydocellales bacterium]
KGRMTIEEMLRDITYFISENPQDKFRLVVGTDSQPGTQTCFVSAVIIYRVGKGARFFYRKTHTPRIPSIRQRIFREATESLELADKLTAFFSSQYPQLTIEVHLDIGNQGKTGKFSQQVVGMVSTCGFLTLIKPFSYAATKVADRYTKGK